METLIAYFKAQRGRQKALAEALGISQAAVSSWQNVPIDRLIEIEKHTGIPRQILRPEFYQDMPRVRKRKQRVRKRKKREI